MGLKNIPKINLIVEREFAEILYAEGFRPFKDYTTWLKLIDEEVLQIFVFMDIALVEDMSLYYIAQPISTYLMFDYRNIKDREVTMGNNFFRTGKFDEKPYTYISGIYEMESCYQKRMAQLHRLLKLLLRDFDKHRSKLDLYNHYTRDGMTEYSCWRFDFAPLAYEFAEEEIVYSALGHWTWIDEQYYTKDEPPKKLTRNFEKSWQPMQAFAAREAIEKHDLSIYGDYLEKCREFNIDYLKKHMPELWD